MGVRDNTLNLKKKHSERADPLKGPVSPILCNEYSNKNSSKNSWIITVIWITTKIQSSKSVNNFSSYFVNKHILPMTW